MRQFLEVIIATTLFMACLSAVVAHAADSSSCYSISDADTRLYCLAKTRNEPSTCYSIVKPDLRALCLAETHR